MLKNTPYQVYLVGGAVRDELLGLKVVDRDWVITGALPDDLLTEGYQQVGKQFPVFLHPENKEEYALARTEEKQGSGYTGFLCDFSPNITLEEDLVRRDLTINAIAKTQQGTLIDPFNGQIDIQNKSLRHVSDAFIEDPLRVLRVARFAARFAEFGFTVAADTMTLMKHISQSGELSTLSKERVWKELEKALSYKHPEVFFDVLCECDALPHVLPELEWSLVKKEIATHKNVFIKLDKPALIWAFICHKTNLKQLDQLQNRLACPNQFKLYATFVCEFLQTTQFPLPAQEWLDWLNKFSAIKKPQIYSELVIILSLITHTAPSDWEELREKIAEITSKPLVEKGLKGVDLGKAIKQARLASLTKTSNPLISD